MFAIQLGHVGITVTEFEVAIHLGMGLTNGEISFNRIDQS